MIPIFRAWKKQVLRHLLQRFVRKIVGSKGYEQPSEKKKNRN